MPNKNYLSGRRFEYECADFYRKEGFEVLRTAGSHGAFDLIVIKPGGFITLVQCKVVATEAQRKRLLDAFALKAPIKVGHYEQLLIVKVKGQKATMECVHLMKS